jgi:hypothetical protein
MGAVSAPTRMTTEHRIRKTILNQETIHHDGGPRAAEPLRIAIAAAVMENPFAGRYEADLMPFMNSRANWAWSARRPSIRPSWARSTRSSRPPPRSWMTPGRWSPRKKRRVRQVAAPSPTRG